MTTDTCMYRVYNLHGDLLIATPSWRLHCYKYSNDLTYKAVFSITISFYGISGNCVIFMKRKNRNMLDFCHRGSTFFPNTVDWLFDEVVVVVFFFCFQLLLVTF